MAFELSDWQKAAARAYGGGDFAYLANQTFESREAFKEELLATSDTHFVFIINELDAKEDCDSPQEAIDRMNTAMAELQQVISAIESMPEPAAPAA